MKELKKELQNGKRNMTKIINVYFALSSCISLALIAIGVVLILPIKKTNYANPIESGTSPLSLFGDGDDNTYKYEGNSATAIEGEIIEFSTTTNTTVVE